MIKQKLYNCCLLTTQNTRKCNQKKQKQEKSALVSSVCPRARVIDTIRFAKQSVTDALRARTEYWGFGDASQSWCAKTLLSSDIEGFAVGGVCGNASSYRSPVVDLTEV